MIELRRTQGILFLLGFFFLFPLLCAAKVPFIQHVESHIPLENLVSGLVVGDDQSLYLLENDSGEVTRLRLNRDRQVQDMEILVDGLEDPIALVYLGDEELLVAERTSGRILKFNGRERELFAEGYTDISSIRLDGEENIWISELRPGRISKINLNNKNKQVIYSDLDQPSDVLPMNGEVFVSELLEQSGALGRIRRGLIKKVKLLGLHLAIDSLLPNQLPLPIDDLIGELEDVLDEALQGTIVDPIRMVHDLRQPNVIYVSVRSLRPARMNEIPVGGILRVDTSNGSINQFAGDLYGPTDMALTPDGMYVMEETAERISFISWTGRRTVVWQGIGRPRSYSSAFNSKNEFIISQSLPETALWRVTRRGNERVELPPNYQRSFIGGLAALNGNQHLISITSEGIVADIDRQGKISILTREIFSPEKIQFQNRQNVWILDRIFNEIVRMDLRRNNIAQSIDGGEYKLQDFFIQDEERGLGRNARERALFALDRGMGSILQFNEQSNQFRVIHSDLIPEASREEVHVKAFIRVPEQGFIVSLNDRNGTLLWQDDLSSEEIVLATGYEQIVAMELMDDEEVSMLSENGWLRTLTLSFQDEIATPTPSPTNTNTPTIAITPTPTDTPAQEPALTPTPTATSTPSSMNTPTPSEMPISTATPTVTNTPASTSTPTMTPTATPTPPETTGVEDWGLHR